MLNTGRGNMQLTPVVKNLLIINILVFILQTMVGDKIDDLFALHYWHSPYFRWWQLLTYLFMHGGFMHIFFNMFALVMFGRVLEDSLGSQKFLGFYLVCGVGAAMLHMTVLALQYDGFHNAFTYYQEHPTIQEYARMLQKGKLTHPAFNTILSYWSDHPDCSDCARVSMERINEYYMAMVNNPTVGASGAVYGVLFAFGFIFPNAMLFIFPIPMPVKAKWAVVIFAFMELSMGLRGSVDDNIAHFAHLGGMLFAFLLLRAWKVRRMKW